MDHAGALPGEVEAALRLLQEHWVEQWPGVDAGAMAADVRERFTAAARAWGVTVAAPLQGLTVNLVCSGWRGGRLVALKVLPRDHPDEAQHTVEALALAHWARTGVAIELLATRDDRTTLLLDHPLPGVPMALSGLSWEDRLTLLGRLARQLGTAGTCPAPVPPLREWTGWQQALAAEPALRDELDDLVASTEDPVLVHADLQPWNVVSAGEGWRVIHPVGVRGDRNAETWALIAPGAPPLPCSAGGAARVSGERVELYARAAGLDVDRARAWTRLRARAEALAVDALDRPAPDAAGWAVRLHRTADALR